MLHLLVRLKHTKYKRQDVRYSKTNQATTHTHKNKQQINGRVQPLKSDLLSVYLRRCGYYTIYPSVRVTSDFEL